MATIVDDEIEAPHFVHDRPQKSRVILTAPKDPYSVSLVSALVVDINSEDMSPREVITPHPKRTPAGLRIIIPTYTNLK